MWQSLVAETKDDDFTVLAVALDQPDAARPWIDAAAPTYPCLIDRDHRTAALYHFTNVPQAMWIDEDGRIVRPPENAGQTDAFRRMDRTTSTFPDDAIAERARVKALYVDAVKDWAKRGASSPHALDAPGVSARMHLPDATVVEAHAVFRLGQALLRDGRSDEATRRFEKASRLHPDSWAMWRQHAHKDARGLATGDAFWARVDALGDRPYHRPLTIAQDVAG